MSVLNESSIHARYVLGLLVELLLSTLHILSESFASAVTGVAQSCSHRTAHLVALKNAARTAQNLQHFWKMGGCHPELLSKLPGEQAQDFVYPLVRWDGCRSVLSRHPPPQAAVLPSWPTWWIRIVSLAPPLPSYFVVGLGRRTPGSHLQLQRRARWNLHSDCRTRCHRHVILARSERVLNRSYATTVE